MFKARETGQAGLAVLDWIGLDWSAVQCGVQGREWQRRDTGL